MPIITTTQSQKSKQKQSLVPSNYLQHIASYQPQRFFIGQGYFVSPSQQELFHLNGKCRQFIIGNAFGHAEWKGHIDLSRLAAPLAQTVSIRDREIEVYIGDRAKAAPGNELNQPCLASFKSVSSIDVQNLRQICNKNGTQLVMVSQKNKEFTIAIPHFTRYTFQHVPLQKKEVQQRRVLAQTALAKGSATAGRRRRNTERKMKELNQQLDNLASKPKNQSKSDELAGPLFQKNNTSFILEELKEYVVGTNSKFIDKEVPYPISQIIFDSKALEIQNQNRAQYNFDDYQHSIHHTPILQNILISANGDIVEVQKYQQYQKLMFRERKAQSLPLRYGFQKFLKSELDLSPQNISIIVCRNNYHSSVKRLFSLYAILFSYQLCFQLSFKEDYSFIPRAKYTVYPYIRTELIKNWLGWVIKQEYQGNIASHLPIKTKLMQALVLRRPQIVLNQLIIHEKWEQAQIIASLQDKIFRKMIPNSLKLNKQLELVLNQSVSSLEFSDWILSFGFSAFYFHNKPLVSNFAQILASQKIKNQNQRQFGLQFRLFQLFLFIQGQKVQEQLFQPLQPNREELSALWLISNLSTLKEIQKKYCFYFQIHGELLFQNYCYHLSNKLLKIFEDQPIVSRKLIERTKDLTQKQIDSLLALVKDNTSQNFQIDQLVKQGSIMEALRLCVKSNFSSFEFEKKLCSLVFHPKIMLCYKSEVKQQVCQLLSQNYDKFQDLILLLSFERDQNTGINQIKKVIRIYRGESRFSKLIGKDIKKVIISKLKTCITNWFYQKNDLFQKLKTEDDISPQVHQIMEQSNLISNPDMKNL